jgi:hypothetical protein
MKRIALGLAALAVSAVAAHADPFAAAYGNTVTQATPDGKKTIIYVNADKTWERHMSDGMVLKGTYSWQDATHACFTLTDPAPSDPAHATSCSEIKDEHKLGDTWTETMADGKTVLTMSITAGR